MKRNETHEMVARAIGDKIHKLRNERGFTLYKLEKETGVKAHHIAQIEKAQICPRVDILQRLLIALDAGVVLPIPNTLGKDA